MIVNKKVAVRNQAELDFIQATTAIVKTLDDKFNLGLSELTFARKSSWGGVNASSSMMRQYRDGRLEFWVNIKELRMSPEQAKKLAFRLLEGARYFDIVNAKVPLDFVDLLDEMFKRPNEHLARTAGGKLKKSTKIILASRRYAVQQLRDYFSDQSITYESIQEELEEIDEIA